MTVTRCVARASVELCDVQRGVFGGDCAWQSYGCQSKQLLELHSCWGVPLHVHARMCKNRDEDVKITAGFTKSDHGKTSHTTATDTQTNRPPPPPHTHTLNILQLSSTQAHTKINKVRFYTQAEYHSDVEQKKGTPYTRSSDSSISRGIADALMYLMQHGSTSASVRQL
jgi:hypothetical protein